MTNLAKLRSELTENKMDVLTSNESSMIKGGHHKGKSRKSGKGRSKKTRRSGRGGGYGHGNGCGCGCGGW